MLDRQRVSVVSGCTIYTRPETICARREKTAIDQLALAALHKPKCFRNPGCYTHEYVGQILVERPENVQMLGAGRRPATSRWRVRAVRKYVWWLSVAFGDTEPEEPTHMSEYLQMERSDSCNRGSLTRSHRAFAFLEEVAGSSDEERITNKSLHTFILKNMFSPAL